MKYYFSSGKICAGDKNLYNLNNICISIVGDSSATGACEEVSIYWTDYYNFLDGGSTRFTIGVCRVGGYIQKCVSAGRSNGKVIVYDYYDEYDPEGCAENSEIWKPT